VIDPVADPYVVAASKINGGYYQYLHALDFALWRVLNGPVSIQCDDAGRATMRRGYVTFHPESKINRPALL